MMFRLLFIRPILCGINRMSPTMLKQPRCNKDIEHFYIIRNAFYIVQKLKDIPKNDNNIIEFNNTLL